MCLAALSTDRTSIETTLTEDLSKIAEYCKARRLKPNSTKTIVGYFHLANKKAHEKLKLKLGGTTLKHEAHPVYLGVTLDRSLSYKQYCEKISKKVGTCNNIIRMLADSTWEVSADTLRRSSLALAYSAAEYAATT